MVGALIAVVDARDPLEARLAEILVGCTVLSSTGTCRRAQSSRRLSVVVNIYLFF